MSIQDYIDHALESLPAWFSENRTAFEELRGLAVMFDRIETQQQFWHDMTFIGKAVEGPPDWLNQHAIDRGSRRQSNETNEALRARIRRFDQQLTLPAVTALAQAIIDAEGIVGTVFAYPLSPNRAHFGIYTSDTGTGIVFSDGPGIDQVLITLTGGLAGLPIINQDKLTVSGASSAGNDGTFLIEGFIGDDILITNAGAVFETDAAASWSWVKYDVDDNISDGFGRAFLSRGYRMGDNNSALVIILPFGCTTATQASIQQALLDNAGAGIQIIVECRANP